MTPHVFIDNAAASAALSHSPASCTLIGWWLMGSSMAFGQAWNYFTAATTALAAETFKAAAACFGADAARPLPRPYAAGSPPSFCGAVVIKKRGMSTVKLCYAATGW